MIPHTPMFLWTIFGKDLVILPESLNLKLSLNHISPSCENLFVANLLSWYSPPSWNPPDDDKQSEFQSEPWQQNVGFQGRNCSHKSCTYAKSSL